MKKKKKNEQLHKSAYNFCIKFYFKGKLIFNLIYVSKMFAILFNRPKHRHITHKP